MRSMLGLAVMIGVAAAVAGAQVTGVAPATALVDRTATGWEVLPESRLWVDGTSTVQSYTCEAGRLDVRMDGSPGGSVTSVMELQRTVSGVYLTIPVVLLECGNGTMNNHMRNALKADDNPTVSFHLTGHEIVAESDAAGRVRLSGQLTIAGETRPITMQADARVESGSRVRVRGATELNMTEFGVRPPRLMLGTLRVHDPVKVHFDLVINP